MVSQVSCLSDVQLTCIVFNKYKTYYGPGKEHRRRSSVNFGGEDIFAGKYMLKN